MKFKYLMLGLACVALSCTKTSEIDRKVDDLLSRMTLEEKIGQMNQLDYGSVNDGLIAAGKVGSVLNCVDAQKVNAMQKVAVEQSRLGIPLLVARDVIHGFHTIFPIPLGQAATFDPALVEQGARIAAVEASSYGVRWTFSPMLDIARDARWGRIAEGSGEDPYLTCLMGQAMVRGYQGDDLSKPNTMAACAKHFVGYGASEGGRDYNTANIPERVLRNVYLPPFEAAAKSGACTFMTSFNDVNGVPSTGNRWLLDDVLRGEWGWDGMIVTDWNSAGELIAHGFASNLEHAAQLSLDAGVDMDMMAYAYISNLEKLIEKGEVKQAQIDKAVRRILKLKFELGLFDNPYVDESFAGSLDYCPEHLEAARKCAVESAVLLKNEGALPIEEGKTLLVCGPLADAPADQLGTWCFDGNPEYTLTPLQALRKYYKVLYEPMLAYSRDNNVSAFPKLRTAASKADAIVLFLGEEAILSGEAHCLADLHLQGAQSELVDYAAACGKPLVLVVIAGRPLTIEEEIGLSDATLYCFHPGTMGGQAIAELISGREVPSGKLPVCFARSAGQYPLYYNRPNTGRPNTGHELLLDQIPLNAGQTSTGCQSYYLDAGYGPLYTFGYGLSYTTFDYANVKLSKTELKPSDVLKVDFDLINTGSYDADEVPMLFVQDVTGSIVRPVKELKRFTRVHLKAGQSQHIRFELPVKELAFYGINDKFALESGEFRLWVAPDAASGEAFNFKVIK